MQYAILAACRRPGFVFCAGWYRRTFRAKKAQGLPGRSVYEMQAGTCRTHHTNVSALRSLAAGSAIQCWTFRPVLGHLNSRLRMTANIRAARVAGFDLPQCAPMAD